MLYEIKFLFDCSLAYEKSMV